MLRNSRSSFLGSAIVVAASVQSAFAGDAPSSYVPPPPADLIVVKPIPTPKSEFVVIQTDAADWLQAEFSGSAAQGVRVDSVRVASVDTSHGYPRASLEVHWRWAETGRDSLFPNARRMQFMLRLPPSNYQGPIAKGRVPLGVDSIWTCQEGRCVLATPPKVVYNHDTRDLFCAVACPLDDSASLAQKVRDRIASLGTALALRPSRSSAQGSWSEWTLTSGAEDLWTLSVPLGGNAANWVTRRYSRFDVSVLAYMAGAKPSISSSFDYFQGPARYTYNRTANPNLKILEDMEVRVVSDTLVKFGRTLALSGNTRVLCANPIDDSAAAQDSWLVVPNASGTAGLDLALSPIFCGQRTSAWRLVGDSVWLGRTRWPIALTDLLGLSGSDRKATEFVSLRPRLAGAHLDLPWSATVTVRDLAGKRLGKSSSVEAGAHVLDLAGHRGAFLVELQSRDGAFHRMLKGSSLGR